MLSSGLPAQTMFGIVCVLFFLMNTGEGGNSCQIIEAKPFKGRKPWAHALEKSCVSRSGECFMKCKTGNPKCRSFAVGDVSECPSGLQCLLYSEAMPYTGLLSRNNQYSYYVPAPPTCCDEPCLNNKTCHPDTCTCSCPPGYNTHHCICPQANLSKTFNKDQPVTLSEAMSQVESGNQTWGLKEDQSVWVLNKDTWVPQGNRKLKYITVGTAGVWGLDENNDVVMRQGITDGNPFGASWQQIPFPHQNLVQLDSGSSGVVYGVNSAREIYCRNGNSWLRVPGTAEHVSCGDYGCWVVDSKIGRFREGVTAQNCVGRSWVNVTNVDIMKLDTGKTGTVYAISTAHALYRVRGLCSKLPYGSKIWGVVPIGGGAKQVTIGDTHMYVVANNGTVFKYH